MRKNTLLVLFFITFLLVSCSKNSTGQTQIPAEGVIGNELQTEEETFVGGTLKEGWVYLPGNAELTKVAYQEINGLKILDGDIELTEVYSEKDLASQSFALEKKSRRWPGGVIPFIIHSSVAASGITNINSAIAHWENNTPIEFVPRTNEADFVVFQAGSIFDTCTSALGRRGDRQFIRLTPRGTCKKGTLIHEIGHTVGFFHEHNRSDRDDFIKIFYNNVLEDSRSQFDKNTNGINLGPYDYNSIMHDGEKAFGINVGGKKQITIQTIPSGVPIGQRGGLSDLDKAWVNKMYPEQEELWHAGKPGVNDNLAPGDSFGSALATGDFNGDGFKDLAVGIPSKNVIFNGSNKINAGAVHVFYGGSNGLKATGSPDDQVWTQAPLTGNNPEADDQFGYALAAGDFNNDGRDDLAVGSPFEDRGSRSDSGWVNVIFGSPQGLTAIGNQSWDQNSPGIRDTSEAGDKFGFSLTIGDFNGDSHDDLAIGIPGENVLLESGPFEDLDVFNAGAVQVIYGGSFGLTATGDQFWNQNSNGIQDATNEDDQFGYALAAGDFDGDGHYDLAIGVPFEAVLGIIGHKHLEEFTNAGAVNVIYGTSNGLSATNNQYWFADNRTTEHISRYPFSGENLGYSLAAGDFNGDGRDDLAIGKPYATDDSPGHGTVDVLYGSSDRLSNTGHQRWGFSSNLEDLIGEGKPGDNFGASLTIGDFDGNGIDDLAIGAPLNDIGTVENAGSVSIIFGGLQDGSDGNIEGHLSVSYNQMWHQNALGLSEDFVETNDNFGMALAAGDFNNDGKDDLGIGIPGEDIDVFPNAGAVNTLYNF